MITDDIYQTIVAYDRIAIFGHVYPDGDCYGSQIGLREALRSRFPEKQIWAIGSGFRPFLQSIAPMDQVDDASLKGCLAIIVDVSTAARVEDPRFQLAAKTIKIDHHVPDQTFTDLEWIEQDAIAVADMIARFVSDYHMVPTKAGAEALCLGIVTDTGRFQFGRVPARTYRLIGEMIARGADLQKLYDVIYSVQADDLRLRGYIGLNFKQTPMGVAYIMLDPLTIGHYHIGAHRAANEVNVLANIKGCPIWVIFADDGKDIYVEMRSVERYNIQPVAKQFAGGGHENAAGCILSDLAEAPAVLTALDALIRQGTH